MDELDFTDSELDHRVRNALIAAIQVLLWFDQLDNHHQIM